MPLFLFVSTARTAMILSATIIGSGLIVTSVSAAEPKPQHFRFRDATRDAGLLPGLEGLHGHAAGWGDVNDDGWTDLYVGTFHSEGPPNRSPATAGRKPAARGCSATWAICGSRM